MALVEIFFAAVHGGNLALVKSLFNEDTNLVQTKDQRGFTPLHIAVEGDYRDIAEFLLQNGADVNEGDLHGYRALHVVRSREMAELLIAHGADVNARENYGLTPLHNAVIEGYKDIVELLIAKGSDIHAVENKGFTPLKMAVKYKLPEIEASLRKNGAIM